MKERIKELRKVLSLSQGTFAEKLGCTANYVWMIENGHREITDKTVFLICNFCGVNETWLRTGEGEMFNPKDREAEIGEIAASIYNDSESNPFKYELQRIISQMDAEQIATFKEIVVRLYDAIEKENSPE